MSDAELRRLDLKSRMLSTEINQLEQQGSNIASHLKSVQHKIESEKLKWSQYLKQSIIAYRNAEPKLQAEILKGKLKTLSSAQQLIAKQKDEKNKLGNKLNALLIAHKQKKLRLNKYQSKKNKHIELKTQHIEQNNLDELSSIKSTQKKHDLNINELLKRSDELKDKFNELPLNKCSDIASVNVNLAQTISTQAQQQINPANLLENPPRSTQQENMTESNSSRIKQQWESANEFSEQRQKQNDPVQVSVLQTSEGAAVCVDCLLAPGRMLSIAGTKLSNSAQIDLTLSASTIQDSTYLADEQSLMLDELNRSGLKVASLEVLT